MWQYNYTYRNELYHHGILGQKWGVRRYQNKDGSLTAEGKKKYNPETMKRYTSKERYEQKYREQGMSEETARLAAERSDKTKKILLTMAGITVAACAAYAGYKIGKQYLDKTIRVGTTLQRIEYNMDNADKLNKQFYAAYGRHDKKRYEGMLAKFRNDQGFEAYKMQIPVNKKLKVASPHNTQKIFNELYESDNEFKKMIDANYKSKGSRTSKDVLKDIYERYNKGMVEPRIRDSEGHKRFIEAVKKKGYDGVLDINDQKYSGFNAKKPTIFFNVDDKVGKITNTHLADKDLNRIKGNKEWYKVANEKDIKTYGPAVAAGAAYVEGLGGIVLGADTKAINGYRSQHPNTKKTDKEILTMLYSK